MSRRHLIRVTLPSGICAGVVTDDDKTILTTAPIFKRWRGEHPFVFLLWVRSKGGTFEQVHDPAAP